MYHLHDLHKSHLYQKNDGSVVTLSVSVVTGGIEDSDEEGAHCKGRDDGGGLGRYGEMREKTEVKDAVWSRVETSLLAIEHDIGDVFKGSFFFSFFLHRIFIVPSASYKTRYRCVLRVLRPTYY